MDCRRFIVSLASITGALMLSSVVAFGQPATSGSEPESSPAEAPAPRTGMMGRQGMMDPEMMSRRGGAMSMQMNAQMMRMMMTDPKTRGQMMKIQGRMMKEMGDLMEKRGQELEQGK
jgi:hypothetical protein